jgi:isocitrate dehydrogenase
MKTLEDGIHTADIFDDSTDRERPSRVLAGTREFADAVIERMRAKATPEFLPSANFDSARGSTITHGSKVGGSDVADSATLLAATRKRWSAPRESKTLHGVDMFLNWGTEGSRDPEALARLLRTASRSAPRLELRLITNRGVAVWPSGHPETFCVDHWRCRFRTKGDQPILPADVVELHAELVRHGFDVIKTENLHIFTNVANGNKRTGFSMGQGE